LDRLGSRSVVRIEGSGDWFVGLEFQFFVQVTDIQPGPFTKEIGSLAFAPVNIHCEELSLDGEMEPKTFDSLP